jgi:Flp pilus assembly protein TadG
MKKRASVVPPSREHGQTIVLVAITIVTLLAMVALAIDVVTLYVAKGEVQRAADAAALVAAKAFVDSGVTSDPANTNLQTLAENMANAGITGVLAQNKVAGVAPVLGGTPTFDFTTYPGNPQVTVTLQRTGLSVFFARIWSRAAPSVSATAKAEAYNPAKSQTNTGNYIPVTLKNIKPLLIANQDNSSPPKPFVDPATGAVTPGEITGQPLTFKDACASGNPNNPCVVLPATLPPGLQFLPAVVTSGSAKLCPSCQGSSDFEQCIECGESKITNQTSSYSCGGAANNALLDTISSTKSFRDQGRNGVQCLINSPSNDTILPANFPSGPMQITAGSGPLSGKLVSSSRSIANFPIIDSSAPITTANVRIIGFLQGFIGTINTGGGGDQVLLTVTILNIAGCGNNPGSQPVVSGGGYSAIPVRLIQ